MEKMEGFLGLQRASGPLPASNYGKGVIIGILDSGITAGHPSFSDKGVPPPPTAWKGPCELAGPTIAGNNKLIGAQNITWADPGPPTDRDGHGTHTASTAAGNFVQRADLLGQASGTAAGVSPLAHVAAYKVCSDDVCYDIMAALEAGIEDGVPVISFSIGGASHPFHQDGAGIGALRAVQRGILFSCSASNNGPNTSSLSNEAPWMVTVGASTTDRKIAATAILGNGEEYEDESANQTSNFSLGSLLPAILPGGLGNGTRKWCRPRSLDGLDVRGKVVLCEKGRGIARVKKGKTVKDARGAAMILMNDEATVTARWPTPTCCQRPM